MDHEMSVDINAGCWLTAPYVCPNCTHDSPVTILVATQGDESWGNMIASSRLYLGRSPWTVFAPGIALALTVLAINLVGDGLRDRLDPRLARRM